MDSFGAAVEFLPSPMLKWSNRGHTIVATIIRIVVRARRLSLGCLPASSGILLHGRGCLSGNHRKLDVYLQQGRRGRSNDLTRRLSAMYDS